MGGRRNLWSARTVGQANAALVAAAAALAAGAAWADAPEGPPPPRPLAPPLAPLIPPDAVRSDAPTISDAPPPADTVVDRSAAAALAAGVAAAILCGGVLLILRRADAAVVRRRGREHALDADQALDPEKENEPVQRDSGEAPLAGAPRGDERPRPMAPVGLMAARAIALEKTDGSSSSSASNAAPTPPKAPDPTQDVADWVATADPPPRAAGAAPLPERRLSRAARRAVAFSKGRRSDRRAVAPPQARARADDAPIDTDMSARAAVIRGVAAWSRERSRRSRAGDRATS